MRVPRCWTVVLAVVLVAASVMPAGAVTESGGFGGGLVAVGAGGFSDVDDGSVHAPAVEVLAASGVFDGTECGQGLFCPGDPILRWEMAVWLVRVLDRTEPDTVGSSRFADVYTDVWWASYVERFAELEVTQGCATEPLRYCPDEVATRAQMASFLVRAFGFPAGASAGFSDVGVGETHTANIDALAASRVTAGCATGPLRYCPDKHVTRAQMATFLARAAGLVDLPAPVGTQPQEPPVFDPFTTPTVSDIDLERLGEAVATLDPEVGCPPTVAPGSLDDVAEVVRISDGCLNIEYIPLQGHTIAQVRQGLASDPDVHAVDLPVTDLRLLDFHYDEVGKEQFHLKSIEANKLWDGWTDDGRGWSGWPAGADVVVAVIDTGVDETHRDLDANVVTTVDVCHRTVTHSHGTHVAGIIAAERNRRDAVGVAPKAKILPVRLLAGDCVHSLAASIDLAVEHGADVINMSLGGPSRDATTEAVIRAAMMRDVVVVAAAGNCGDNTVWTYKGKTKRGWEHEECNKHNVVEYPAAYSGLISVASTDSGGVRAASSTANRHVGIAAPGSGILSTVPSYTAGGNDPCTAGTTCYVGYKSGTSMAAPVIAGVVAHMKARFPKASVGEIRQALYTTAKQPNSTETGRWTKEYGWGVVQPLHAIERLDELFAACPEDADNRGLLAFRVGVDIDADGDDVDDSRVSLVDRSDIWTMDAVTSEGLCRRAHNAWQPEWSPDGTRLAFVHKQSPNDDNEIWVMNTDGTNWRNLTDNNSAEYQPAWSPDGTRIAYVSDRSGNLDVWVMNTDGTSQRNLTQHPAWDSLPAWSPDGTKIAFNRKRDGADFDIWVMNANGTGARNLHDNNDEEVRPAWSPDGTRIAFVHNPDEPGNRDDDIWVMNTDGTNWRNLTNHPAEDTGPAWSPDGTRIAFVSDRGGNNDIWVLDPDGTNPRNLTNTANLHETQPAWSPPKEAPPDDRQGSIYTPIAAGTLHSCGIRTDGSVLCWGNNGWGEAMPPSGSFTTIAAGGHHSCGIRTDGSVACWGSNGWGEATPPVESFTTIAVSSGHSCGIRTDGSVLCWGSNIYGRETAPSGSFTAIASGNHHSCGIRTDGSVLCWGSNYYGEATPPSGSFQTSRPHPPTPG